jgi:hypothetical protein
MLMILPETREDFFRVSSCRGSNKGDSVVILVLISDIKIISLTFGDNFFPIQVLSVLDSNYHTFNEVKKSSVTHATEKRLYDHSQVRPADYKEKISISIPYIGISLISSYPQVIEL